MNINKIQLNNRIYSASPKPSDRMVNKGEVKTSVNSLKNPSFKHLYASPETLKKIGLTEKTLLENPIIKECAGKFDVLVKAGKKTHTIDRHDGMTRDKLFPTAYLLATIWGLPHVGELLTAIGITDHKFIAGTGIAMFCGAIYNVLKLVTKKVHEIEIQGAQQFVPTKDDEFEPRGMTTMVYNVKQDSFGKLNDFANIAEAIEDLEHFVFNSICISGADFDNMFTPENYLKNIKQIKEKADKQYIKDIFKYPINRGGDTLLTAFFDVAIPRQGDSEEKIKAYYEIINMIKTTDKANFNQKDSQGIPILEKIMNTENSYILPIIKGCKFSYSPYLKYAYDNIQDKTFKNQLRSNIDFDFSLLEKKEYKDAN